MMQEYYQSTGLFRKLPDVADGTPHTADSYMMMMLPSGQVGYMSMNTVSAGEETSQCLLRVN